MSKSKRKTAKPRKASTALTRIPARRPVTSLVVNDPHQMLAPVGTLGDDAAVGALGQVEVKLTEAEEQILSEQVERADVRMKPSGQPYLSHPTYTRWFNRAFGRLGWAIVPQSKPIRTVNGKKVSVVCPYMFYVHGQPAAFAMGEQEYFEDSREQTYGDALEATVASALRRCAKRLGVGLELWDKPWLQAYIERECVQVRVKARDGKIITQWRRKIDPKLPYELGGASQGVEEAREPAPERTTAEPATDLPTITTVERQRLGRLVKTTGRNEAEVRLWLKKRYGVTDGAHIMRRDYSAICDQIAVKGALPMPGDGE
jgi:hypothetical protein